MAELDQTIAKQILEDAYLYKASNNISPHPLNFPFHYIPADEFLLGVTYLYQQQTKQYKSQQTNHLTSFS